MSRLVLVSNRVADPKRPAAGGMAVALHEALTRRGGLWFGWNGEIDADEQLRLSSSRDGRVQFATMPLSREDHDAYYVGYANGVLWPVFHYRLDLAKLEQHDLDGYERVNRQFARQLAPLLRDDDIVWVHDYHLLPLASELRALGCRQRIGFFLHIPLPPAQLLAAVPAHERLMRSLFAYNLVGLQCEADVANFIGYAERELGARRSDRDTFHDGDRSLCVRAFPIGIDVDEFANLLHAREGRDMLTTMREQYGHRQLLVGVDRLDYTKGLPQRIRAFKRLLDQHPEHRNSATLIQVASPSRETVAAYGSIRRELERLCGAINGEYGELEWMPVRYLHRNVHRRRLPGLFRAARVALVTPLRDGMNLVAKEFIAAQDPDDPGVLVLSRFAGAAERLTDAVLVNPYDAGAMAEAMQRALQMDLGERRARHSALLHEIRSHDVHWWCRSFLAALEEVSR